MHALPLLTIYSSDEYEFTPGTLLKLPPELSDRSHVRRVLNSAKPGWSKDDLGYHSYMQETLSGRSYIVPGIRIAGSKPKRNFVGYEAEFEKADIEKYLTELIKRDEAYKEHAEDDLNLLVHDLRRLSSAIYHQATEALGKIPPRFGDKFTHVPSSDIELIQTLLNSVIASQTMLKIRTDALDYEGAPHAAPIYDRVQIYRKFDKVRQCFTPLASDRGIDIKISGSSYGFSAGPDVFEIIPYVIIDNAVKYSPDNGLINIRVSEADDYVICSVESQGPKILDDELNKIFSKGFRGSVAQKSGKTGSGLGLFLAHNLVDSFRGSIEAFSIHREKGEYCTNIFTVKIPKLGEIDRPTRVREPKMQRKGSARARKHSRRAKKPKAPPQ